MNPLTLETARLILRPFTLDDCAMIQAILGDRNVSQTLMDMPHPFTAEDAEIWIKASLLGREMELLYSFAMTRKLDGLFMGCVDIELHPPQNEGDIAYWLAKEHWGQGYATEAAHCMVTFGFETLKLKRIYAQCLQTNTASARVMQKAGLRYESQVQQRSRTSDQLVNVTMYGLTQADYESQHE